MIITHLTFPRNQQSVIPLNMLQLKKKQPGIFKKGLSRLFLYYIFIIVSRIYYHYDRMYTN